MIVCWFSLQEFTDSKTDGDKYHVPLSPPYDYAYHLQKVNPVAVPWQDGRCNGNSRNLKQHSDQIGRSSEHPALIDTPCRVAHESNQEHCAYEHGGDEHTNSPGPC